MLWLVRFAFSKEDEEEEESVKIVFLPVFHTSCDIVVTFSHVLHLDVLRRQIESEISLCMAIMQNHPLPSLYTQYYRTV